MLKLEGAAVEEGEELIVEVSHNADGSSTGLGRAK